LTKAGQRWLGGLPLSLSARAQVDVYLRLLAALEAEKRQLEAELRDFARSDRRCQALETIYGVGPLIARVSDFLCKRVRAVDLRSGF
jgi:transposase